MRTYSTVLPALLGCFLLGGGIGWYFGYTRPNLEAQRHNVAEYRKLKREWHMTDKQMSGILRDVPQMREDLKRQEEFAAAVSLGAFRNLEIGNTQRAKWELMTTVSGYYRGHKYDGNTNLIRLIVSYAATNSALSNAIYRKLDTRTGKPED